MRVALIDDDPAVLDSLRLYLSHNGIDVAGYDSADRFLGALAAGPSPDCIVADVRMPGLSGLDLARRLADEGRMTPVILITGHGDVAMAVGAIKLGVFDFIEKPFDERRLLEAIRSAISDLQRRQLASGASADLRARYDSLSERQRQVFDLAAAGLSNKEIGARLGISFRTVENHRAWLMERMGARNLAELIRMEMQVRPPRG